MKTFISSLVATLVIGMAASSSLACNGRGGGGGGYNGGYGGGLTYRSPARVVTNARPQPQSQIGRTLEPFHSTHNPFPTDSFYIVSLKEYGTSDAAPYIAKFNGMKPSDSLANVERLHLPSISVAGKMTQSRAPLSDADQTVEAEAKVATAHQTKATTPTAPSAPLPNIASGSTLKIDGQTLGEAQGLVRLRVSGVALPVSVVEWTAESAKIRLPNFEVAAATKAEIEVVRADGTVAATTGLNLMPADQQSSQIVKK